MAVIRCRARAVEDCEHDCTTSMGSMREDSTWDGESIVCNACYIEIEPLMRMNAPGGVLLESNTAIRRYQDALEYLHQHPNPEEAIVEMRSAAVQSREGSPRFKSAMFLAELAEREVKGRKK